MLGLVLGACGSSSRPAPPVNVRHSSLITIFEAPVQLSSGNPGPTLDLLRRLGVDDVRISVRWSTVAPAATARAAPHGFSAVLPGAYPAAGWAPYDAVVREAAARHMGVLMDVTGPAPAWASARRAPPGGVPGVWKPSAASFGRFVHAVAERYSGRYTPPGAGAALPRVSFWSIWNEPNLGQANLAPQAVQNSRIETAPRMYRALLDAAWGSLQATGHGRDTILIGELAPYGIEGPGNFGYMYPMRFVRALYCVDAALHPLRGTAAAQRGCPSDAAGTSQFARQNPALFQASGFAVHPYPSGPVAPNLVLPDGPDFLYLATLSRLEHFLDTVTQRYGVPRRFLLYSTEYGYKTNPPYPLGAPLPLAAQYLNWAEYMTWRTPRLRSWDQYLLIDPPAGGPSQFDTGLETDGGQPKPTFFDAWRLPIFLPRTRQTSGAGLEVWGCARPAHYVSHPAPVRIELQTGGRGAFRTVATVPISDPNGYFDTVVRFPSAGQVRLAWSYPDGETIHSRLVAITVGG